jgi:hypothetical protein
MPLAGLALLIVSLWNPPAAWPIAKVYLANGETRVGYVNVRDGRVTVRGEDRLFQNPERAVHRIEHVTGDTALIGKDNILLRESAEKLSKTLVAIPKGCEVIVLGRKNDWVQIEVYGGQTLARGFVYSDDLSDSVLLNPPLGPSVKFKDPPPTLREKYPETPVSPISATQALEMLQTVGGLAETDFGASALRRAREDAERQQRAAMGLPEVTSEEGSPSNETDLSGQIAPATP